MAVVNVQGRYVGGDIELYDVATGDSILTIKADGTLTLPAAAISVNALDVPTVDPEDGVSIWNDSGALKLSVEAG